MRDGDRSFQAKTIDEHPEATLHEGDAVTDEARTPSTDGSLQERLRSIPFLGTLLRTFEKAVGDGAKDSAAAIAYYAFFSLFPLLLGLVAGLSFALDSGEVRARIDEFLVNSFPGSSDLITEILDSVIRLRGAAGMVAVATLLWAASAAFGAVSRTLDRAWGTSKRRPFYVSRFRYFLMCLAVALLALLSVLVTGFVELVVGLDLQVLSRLGITDVFTQIGGRIASFAFMAGTFALLYKVMPRHETTWEEVLPGALLASVLIEAAKSAFLVYLNNVADFEAVYGSLSSAIGLLLWLYISAWALILGAEFVIVRELDETAAT
jgi:membrane protein